MKLHELRDKLKLGFYVNNLFDLAGLCRDLALEVENPTPFFVLREVFYGIARLWEDRPLPVEEAQFVETTLMQPIEQLLDGIEKEATSNELLLLLNNILSGFQIISRMYP